MCIRDRSGPVLYIIWRRRYGGLTRKDPEMFPGNPRTGLAVGDIKRISVLCTIFSVMNIIACFFMPWYEAWGDPENGWESSDYFDGLLSGMDVNVILTAIHTGLYIVTAVSVIGAIVTFLMSKKVEE